MSSDLKQGPLAPVWMAANYEKKLTKQQFLNTNIVTSTSLLAQPISSSESITLRLSGQLLLGIVRIYSRKTKYLLDDVNDILFKLKNAFKYASGGVLLSSDTSNRTQTGTQRGIITNLNTITLPDRITSYDLLYQEDLNLDNNDNVASSIGLLSQANEQNDVDMDDSIEYGRFNDFGYDNNNMINDDLDFDLDFGNGNDDGQNDSDKSIEVGRNANTIQNDFSLLDLGQDNEKFDLGFELGETTPIIEDNASSPEPNEPVTPPSEPEPTRPRRKLVGITEDGTLKTNKRKIQIDTETEVNTGVSIEELQHLRDLQLTGDWRNEVATFKLNDGEKLQLINDLSQPAGFKRRRLGDLNAELSNICKNLSAQERDNEAEELEEDQFGGSFDDFDFDVSVPDFGDDSINEVEFEESFTQSQNENEAFSTTKKVADIIKENNNTTFSEIIHKDSTDINPLGGVRRGGERQLNMKKEASKCFFELLVLATRDCVTLQQDASENITDIAGEINVTAKDNLFSSFI